MGSPPAHRKEQKRPPDLGIGRFIPKQRFIDKKFVVLSKNSNILGPAKARLVAMKVEPLIERNSKQSNENSPD